MEIKFESLPGVAFNKLYEYVRERSKETDGHNEPILELKEIGKVIIGANDLLYQGVNIVLRDNNYLTETVETLRGLAKALSDSLF